MDRGLEWLVYILFLNPLEYPIHQWNCYSNPFYLNNLPCNSRFTEFGGPVYGRPVQDLAFAVARFVQKGGSLFNYYMVGQLAQLTLQLLWT